MKFNQTNSCPALLRHEQSTQYMTLLILTQQWFCRLVFLPACQAHAGAASKITLPESLSPQANTTLMGQLEKHCPSNLGPYQVGYIDDDEYRHGCGCLGSLANLHICARKYTYPAHADYWWCITHSHTHTHTRTHTTRTNTHKLGHAEHWSESLRVYSVETVRPNLVIVQVNFAAIFKKHYCLPPGHYLMFEPFIC